MCEKTPSRLDANRPSPIPQHSPSLLRPLYNLGQAFRSGHDIIEATDEKVSPTDRTLRVAVAIAMPSPHPLSSLSSLSEVPNPDVDGLRNHKVFGYSIGLCHVRWDGEDG